jgi:Tfp pilus assembly protein PilN
MRHTISLISVIVALSAGVARADGHAAREGRARSRIEQDRPRNVIVESIEFNEANIVIRGYSGNVNSVANFVENLKNDPMFTVPEVMYVQTRKGSSPPVYEFEFRVAINAAAGDS